MLKTTKWDAADYIDSPEMAAEYLTACAEEGEAVFFAALGDVARAYGMGKIAAATGAERSGLYRALSKDATNTQFATVSKVLHAVGLKMEIKAA